MADDLEIPSMDGSTKASLRGQIDDAYRFLEEGAATPVIASQMRSQPLIVWFKVAANTIDDQQKRLEVAERGCMTLRQELEAERTKCAEARTAAIAECIRAVLGGRFLSDTAPTKMFADEVAAMLGRLAKAPAR